MKQIKKIIGFLLLIFTIFYYLKVRFPLCVFEDYFFNPFNAILDIIIAFAIYISICIVVIHYLIYPCNKSDLTKEIQAKRKELTTLTFIILLLISIPSFVYTAKCSKNPQETQDEYKWVLDLHLLF